MGKYFGTDGFRGEAGITLTADHAYKVGRFLGWYYNALRERNGDTNPARIVIGKDTRRSSYMFEYSLVAGLTASGADAYLLHVTTTPSVAYIARVDDFDCGIMISASHNLYYDNGIKLIDCYGEKMPEEILLLVKDYIDGKLHFIVKTIIAQLSERLHDPEINESLIKHVEDRLGHDRRYGIDPSKIKADLGWYPETTFEVGIVKTIDWYLDNQTWMDRVTSGEYQKYYKKMYKNR